MTSSRIPLALVAAAALAAGCDRLATEPGQDFAVRVLTPMPITAIGKITVPVRFAVDGCSAFDASVRGGDGASHPVESARQADGAHLADVPVEWLREEDRTCMNDARNLRASAARLTVTCRDADRSATAELQVRYGTALQASTRGAIIWPTPDEFLLPSADPLFPRLLYYRSGGSAAWLSQSIWWMDDLVPMHLDPVRKPLLVENGSSLFVVSGCLLSAADYGGFLPTPLERVAVSCPPVAVSPSVSVPSEALWGVSLEGNGDSPRYGWWPIWVPDRVVDLALLADGTVLVLSSGSAGATVTRVLPARMLPSECRAPEICTAPASVEVLAHYPGEQVQTGFSHAASGELSFLTGTSDLARGTPVRSVFHATDGQTVSALPDPTGAIDLSQPLSSVQLSPDGRWLLLSHLYLGPPAGPFAPLPTAADPFASGAWFSDRLALVKPSPFSPDLPSWEDYGSVQIFDAAPPHALVATYEVHPLPGARATAQLWGAVGVGDRLVLTTRTGVRILDREGRLVGGADPLPCGLTPTSLAIATGPTTAAVRADSYLYVFDLADPP